MGAVRIREFEFWQPGYAGAAVSVYVAGTTTLADIYTDEALTNVASNPQTLETYTEDGRTYGKFTAPLYTGSAYELDIDSEERSGVQRIPLTSFDGEDASDAVVTTTDGTRARALADRFDDVIHALDYGTLDATDSATNNTTLTAAIGAAAANGGGTVLLSEGTYPFTALTLSEGVVLRGEGREVTTLQCQTGDNVITLGGDRAGLRDLTLDGVNLVAGSVGVYSKANDETVFDDVEIKRFVTGIHFKGGRRAAWRNLYIDNCTDGAKLHGDTDAGGGADGDQFRNNRWQGGKVSTCTSTGVGLSFEDTKVFHNFLVDIGFEDNTGTALDINGARYTFVEGCWASNNTTVLAVDDDDDTDNEAINTVIGLRLVGCDLDGGAVTFTGTCQDVILDGCEISDVDFTLTLPTNAILVRNCIEDSDATISGDGTKYTRWRETNKGQSSGVTTDATPTKAWSIHLEPGQVGVLRAQVVAVQRDSEDYAVYDIERGFRRPGADLAYDAQTANFTVGDIVTGGTSGATARIIADSDSGTTGTLTLKEISGTFENNETITDESGGSATVNGTISTPVAALLGSLTSQITAVETVAGWDAAFVSNGSDEIELQVTGAASDTVDWLCHVEAVIN